MAISFFFAAGIARQADNLHAIQQRGWNIQGVGGSNEEYAGQVHVGLQIVVAKRGVLRRIKDFK